MSGKPSITFVIPTRNSFVHLERCLLSLRSLEYPKDKLKIIIVDNGSTDKTIHIAHKFGVRVLQVTGDPPKVSNQRNLGLETANTEYVYFLDHDMILPVNFLQKFADQVTDAKNVDISAWYVPEIVTGTNTWMSRIKTFEKSSYSGTSVAAARIFRKANLDRLGLRYDPVLSCGPADWDFDLQLIEKKAVFGVLDTPIIHNEENLHLADSIKKKWKYTKGIELYKSKWKRKNVNMYNRYILGRQFNPIYRFIGIFFEYNNLKRTLLNPHLYLATLAYKFTIALGYEYEKRRCLK